MIVHKDSGSVFQKKVFIVTNMVAPYRMPLFNALAKKLPFRLSVFFFTPMEKDRQWDVPYNDMKFKYNFLPGIGIQLNSFVIHIRFSLFHYLMCEKPDIVIIGGFSLQTLLTMCYARLMHRAYIIWSEATLHSEQHQGMIRTLLRKWLVKNADGFVAVSKGAKEYCQYLGASSDRIYIAIQTLGVSEFSDKCRLFRKKKNIYKKEIGLEKNKIMLYSGQLIRRKGLLCLLKVLKQISKKCPNLILLVLGDGPEISNLRSFCQDNGILNNVRFIGFKQMSELPMYYAVSDLFVFPTLSDTFGIAVNEAIAAGLPIICSKYAGAAKDLLRDGENGFVVDPLDTEDFSNKCIELLTDDDMRREMGRRSKAMMKLCTIDRAASGFMSAINCALSNTK